MGVVLARAFPFPAGYQALLSGDNLAANLGRLEPFLGLLPLVIVTQNLRVLLLGALLGTFTFGVLGILVFMAPWAVLAFLAAQVALAGGSPLAFLLATVVPHGLVELPALFLAAAAALPLVTAAANVGELEDALGHAEDLFSLLIRSGQGQNFVSMRRDQE